MRIDELDMDNTQKYYPKIFQQARIKAWRDSKALCDKWEQDRLIDPALPHPLEKLLGRKLPRIPL